MSPAQTSTSSGIFKRLMARSELDSSMLIEISPGVRKASHRGEFTASTALYPKHFQTSTT
jgi:hypothetical protein